MFCLQIWANFGKSQLLNGFSLVNQNKRRKKSNTISFAARKYRKKMRLFDLFSSTVYLALE